MPRSWIQVLFVVAFALAIFVIWDFSQRVMTSVSLTQSEQAQEQAVERAQATKDALLAQKKYVQSDQFVEDYARDKWGWVKDGEKIAIPLITLAPTPVISAPPPPTPTPEPSFWQAVWDFLFGP